MSARKPLLEAGLSVPEERLYQVFDAVNNFPRSNARPHVTEMELTKFHRVLRDLELYGPNLTTLDVDMIHIKCKPRGAKKLNLTQFGIALEMCAERLSMSASEIIDKAIELGVPLPSAPPPPEWDSIPQQLLQHTQHCGPNCRCGRDIHHVGWNLSLSEEDSGPAVGTPTSSKKVKGPVVTESVEDWQKIKEETEALRARYGIKGKGYQDLGSSAGPKKNGRSPIASSYNGVSSDSKLPRNPRGSPGGGASDQHGQMTPRQAAAEQVTPFVITENEASPPLGAKDGEFQSPEGREPRIDLFTAFSIFCSTSPHKEFEPGMNKTEPLMLQVEFRRMCRQCGLKPKVASASEQPDMVFFIVASRAKSKFLDFDLFLSALERLALSCRMSFTEVERRICITAEGLAGDWSEEP